MDAAAVFALLEKGLGLLPTLIGAGLLHGEPHDLPRALAPHLAHQRVVGVEDGVAVARHRLDDDGLDVGELLEEFT